MNKHAIAFDISDDHLGALSRALNPIKSLLGNYSATPIAGRTRRRRNTERDSIVRELGSTVLNALSNEERDLLNDDDIIKKKMPVRQAVKDRIIREIHAGAGPFKREKLDRLGAEVGGSISTVSNALRELVKEGVLSPFGKGLYEVPAEDDPDEGLDKLVRRKRRTRGPKKAKARKRARRGSSGL